MPWSFWTSFLEKVPVTTENSEDVSVIMAKSLPKQKGKLSRATFGSLASKLTSISIAAASNLLKLDCEITDNGDVNVNPTILTSFQTMCLQCMAEHIDKDVGIKLLDPHLFTMHLLKLIRERIRGTDHE